MHNPRLALSQCIGKFQLHYRRLLLVIQHKVRSSMIRFQGTQETEG
jgi:hypothetical protein